MTLYDEQYKKGTKVISEQAKEPLALYKQYQKSISDNSPFDTKTNELLMLAVSSAIQCSYCIDTHSKRAKNAGATDQEMSYAVLMAAAVKHGATVSYGVTGLSHE